MSSPYNNQPSQPQWIPPQGQQYPTPPQNFQFQPPQGPYVPPPRKSHKGLWIALGIGLVVVIGFCAIVGMAANGAPKATVSTTSNNSNTGASTNQSTATPDSGNTTAKIGQSITVDGVSCTATSAQILPAGQYDTPKKGQEYIVVHVKMANNGQSDQSYNPYDFHAKSSAGNVTDYTYTSSYTANNALDSGTMAPGGKVEGDLVFQIPIGDSKAELTWAPSFFNSSSQYAWILNVK